MEAVVASRFVAQSHSSLLENCLCGHLGRAFSLFVQVLGTEFRTYVYTRFLRRGTGRR